MKNSINLTVLYRKYPGKWVALKDDERTLIAAGKTAKEVLAASRKNGEKAPVLHKIPTRIALSISLSGQLINDFSV